MSGLHDIRHGDRRLTIVSAAAVFSFAAAYALLEAARDGIFLGATSASRLPLAYVGIAVLALLVGRPARSRDARARLSLGLGVAALVTAGFAAFVDRPLVPIALYLWIGALATATLSRLWLLIGNLFTPGQAKRLYALIGAGGLLGATLGSAVAAVLARVLTASGLLLVGAAALAVSAAVIGILLPAAPADDPEVARPQPMSYSSVLHAPYLRRLLIIAASAAAAATILDFAWKSSVAAQVPAADLPGFFATAGAVFSALAFVAQLIVVPLVVGRGGATAAVATPPALLAALSALAAGGALLPLLLARAADAALRGTLGRTGLELLLVPLPRALRGRVKPVLEAIGTRGGQAAAAGLILAALALGAHPAHLAVLAAVIALLGIAATSTMKGRALILYRESLRDGHSRTLTEMPAQDPLAALSLVEALSSEDDEEVATAMDLLARGGRARLIPTAILHHPSPQVSRRALTILAAAGRPDFLRASAALHRHPDGEIRALTLRLRAALGADDIDPFEALDDPSPVVQTAALVALLRRRPGQARATRVAFELARSGPLAAKVALAQAIGDQPDEQFLQVLVVLAGDSRRPVQAEVARAVLALPSRVFVPRLVEMLVDRDLRGVARQALLAVGSGALDYLQATLADGRTPRSVRRHLPRTISLFATPRAAGVLLRQLAVERDGAVRFKLLRGLGRMRADHPALAIDEVAVHALAERTVKRALEVLSWRVALGDEPAHGDDVVLVSLLAEKERQAIERLFRLVGILRPRDELELVYDGLHSGDRRRHDAAVELLAATVAPDLRAAVVAIVDDELADGDRLVRAGAARVEHDEALAAMAGDHSAPLAALAGRQLVPMRAAA